MVDKGASMIIDKDRYPWAEHVSPDDRIGAVCTYDPLEYLPLFEEKHFETGDERIGTLRYFFYVFIFTDFNT